MVILILSLIFTPLSAADPAGAFALYLLPARQTAPNAQFEYLKNVIFGIITLNMRDQENIALVEPSEQTLAETDPDYAAMIETARGIRDLDVYLLTDYFIKGESLHMSVTLFEAASGRVKNSYIRVMPADLDMIKSIEEMARFVAESVSKSLPKLSRDEILSRQVAAELRDELDRDERLIAEIFGDSHEITICPFAGVSTGKGIGTWSKAGPMASLPLSLEYRFSSRKLWHIGLEIDYLAFDLMQSDWRRSEFSAGLSAGTHTASLVSLGWGIGLRAAWAVNDQTAALSYLDGEDSVYPPSKRFSLGIPLEAAISYHKDSRWFARMRLKYEGLSYTFESLAPADYPLGADFFLYDDGWSPWTLIHFSLSASIGMRL